MIDLNFQKEHIANIKKNKAKARGQTIKSAFGCIENKEGKEGLVRLKKFLKELDCWVQEYDNFKNIKTFKWYPLWYDAIPILAAADLFGWDEEEIKSFGRCNQKISFFEKILLKYFISLKQVFNVAPERWRKHYSEGELKSVKFNGKEKYAIIRLRNFSIHPIFCLLLSGYFESATSFVVPGKKVKSQETKCTFRGDTYHEYIIRWN